VVIEKQAVTRAHPVAKTTAYPAKVGNKRNILLLFVNFEEIFRYILLLKLENITLSSLANKIYSK